MLIIPRSIVSIRHHIEQIRAPRNCATGKTTRNNFRKKSQIRRHPVIFLRTPRCHAKTRNHLVKNEQNPVLACNSAKLTQKIARRGNPPKTRTRRLQNNRSNIVPTFKRLCNLIDIIRLTQHGILDMILRNTARRRTIKTGRSTKSHLIVPPVKIRRKTQNLRLILKSARNAQPQKTRLCPRRRKTHLIRARHHPNNLLCPFQFQLVRRAVMRTPIQLLPHCLGHLRMIMPQNQRTVPPKIIDILTPIHIPLAPPLCPINRKRIGHQIARIVRHPTGKSLPRPLVQSAGLWRSCHIFFDQQIAHLLSFRFFSIYIISH